MMYSSSTRKFSGRLYSTVFSLLKKCFVRKNLIRLFNYLFLKINRLHKVINFFYLLNFLISATINECLYK